MGPAALWVAAGLTALAVALVMRALVPPPARLAGRVRPYTSQGRGAAAMFGPFLPHRGWQRAASVFSRWAARVGSLLEGGGAERLAQRLRQSGLFPGLSGEQALDAFRVKQLGAAFSWLGGSVMIGVALRLPVARTLALAVLGSVIGVARQKGTVDRALEQRRQLMRIEIYTVNQLLAMRVRGGGGVVQAVSQIVARGHGEVVGELAEALRLHRAGMRATDAFSRIAEATPEPQCARTYALLGAADERGADLGAALLALAEDVREGRREALRRAATKRRAAMLVPIIAILAPVMLLFVGAPLPQILFNWR
ncbi:MAG TPA: type II secretion system F family protein [Acidimicrobiia bacterium]|nr:type II secretion system F family protein [Acidimicrobiia bacterium]